MQVNGQRIVPDWELFPGASGRVGRPEGWDFPEAWDIHWQTFLEDGRRRSPFDCPRIEHARGEVAEINGARAHADQAESLAWASRFAAERLQEMFLAQGEREGTAALPAKLQA